MTQVTGRVEEKWPSVQLQVGKKQQHMMEADRKTAGDDGEVNGALQRVNCIFCEVLLRKSSIRTCAQKTSGIAIR